MNRFIGLFVLVSMALFVYSGCSQSPALVDQKVPPERKSTPPEIPPTLSEILDTKNTRSDSPLDKFDYLNFTYPLPRGWQDVDSKEITLIDGKRRMTEEKIGLSYVTRKFGDVTGDGAEEAFVILRVETGGSAIPHVVYVFENGEEGPEILWYFRTGDRSDGGLKRVYADEGDLIVELFGQDRYIFSQMETLKIVGDEPPLCCPDSFTRNRYKRVSNGFELHDKRLTYSLKNPDEPPKENLGEQTLKESRGKDQ